MTSPRIVLSYGMGVDSTAILLRWLADPTSRDFDLSELVVLTCQTGDEFQGTGRLVAEHVLPRLAEAGVRFVEIARAGASERDGVAILQDTREPSELHLAGAYRLSEELRAAATIPTSGAGGRRCSIKAKGFALDRWKDENLEAGSFVTVVGFNADETKRRDREAQYVGEGETAYPLIDWGWSYQDCLDYIEAETGAAWLKSCCTFCPFAGGRAPILARYREEPEAAAQALRLEMVARQFNDRMSLYKTKSLHEIVTRDGNLAALRTFERELEGIEWAVYDVRRIYTGPGRAFRSIRSGEQTFESFEAAAASLGGDVERLDGPIARRVLNEREADTYPAVERFLTVAPAGIADKAGVRDFDARWEALVGQEELAAAAG